MNCRFPSNYPGATSAGTVHGHTEPKAEEKANSWVKQPGTPHMNANPRDSKTPGINVAFALAEPAARGSRRVFPCELRGGKAPRR